MKGKKYVAMWLLGLLLFVEHYVSYGYFDLEVLGHETYGWILMIVGVLGFLRDNLRVKTPVWDSKG